VIWIQLLLCWMGIVSFPYNNTIVQFPTNDGIDPTQTRVFLCMLLLQWSTYIMSLCTFHLAEFFITSIYNPTQATTDSFLVNHSTTYTTAAMSSWIEFWFRFCCLLLTSLNFSLPSWISLIGFGIVILAQIIRSMAMATAGESFNHLIQTSKKQNHVLITHGIYSVFRHPSYVGYFYWAIATQLLLGNIIHTILYSIAAWTFFQRRIHYEEESLCQFFPDTYPTYVSHTYIGIPFLKSRIITPNVSSSSQNTSRVSTIQKDE
jgi:protein-S-isoprenylcysteine O-methyltransferase